MSLADRISEHLRENRTGMVHDMLFAVGWVAFVTVLTTTVFTNAPRWAYYLFMLAGVPAYFGFFISLDVAKERQANRE